MQLNNYTFCNGSKTDLCKKDEVGKFGEIALEVKSRKGKPPKRDDEGGDKGGDKKKKRKMKCHLKHKGSRCPRNFKFGDDEDADEMVAATQVGQTGDIIIERPGPHELERWGGEGRGNFQFFGSNIFQHHGFDEITPAHGLARSFVFFSSF